MEPLKNVMSSLAQKATASYAPALEPPEHPKTQSESGPGSIQARIPKTVEEETHKRVSETVDGFLAQHQVRLKFFVLEDESRVVTQVINEQTGEVIRQIPREKGLLLRLIA